MSRRRTLQITPQQEQPVNVRVAFIHQNQVLMAVEGAVAISLPPAEGVTPTVGVTIDAGSIVPALLSAMQQQQAQRQQSSGGLIVPGRNAPLPAPLFDPKAQGDAKALLKRND